MNIIDGCMARATLKRARTSFSPSPTHLLVRLLELMFTRLHLTERAATEQKDLEKLAKLRQ
jgi:hypothetical protein